MPRARYSSTLEVVTPNFEEMFKGFPKAEDGKLPSIHK